MSGKLSRAKRHMQDNKATALDLARLVRHFAHQADVDNNQPKPLKAKRGRWQHSFIGFKKEPCRSSPWVMHPVRDLFGRNEANGWNRIGREPKWHLNARVLNA